MSAVYLWGLFILPLTVAAVYGAAAGRWLAVWLGLLRHSSPPTGAGGAETKPSLANDLRRAGFSPPALSLSSVLTERIDGLKPVLPDSPASSPEVPGEAAVPGPSRRQVLAGAFAALPPLALAGTVATSLSQNGQFRVKPVTLAPPGWPADLDGFRIAIVADVHTGFFSTTQMLRDIRDTTNNLRADLILLTGDLVNMSLADLSSGMEMVHGMDAPCGVFMCEGNHDLMQSPEMFVERVGAAGIPLLRDTDVIIRKRGRTPFQLWGLRWSDHGQTGLDDSIRAIAPFRQRDLFPILMAHHPHAWDPAAAAGFPLVLSGHTHGGQIMLTPNIGAGPLRFRYWTGIYQRPGSTLLISNGVGNWFPLRVNAPAEIVHLTLRAGGTA